MSDDKYYILFHTELWDVGKLNNLRLWLIDNIISKLRLSFNF